MFCDWSALSPTRAFPFSITLKHFISVVIVIVRTRRLSDPSDYDCEAYDAAYDSAYDYDCQFTQGFNAPYDCDCDYDVSVNQS